MGTVKSILRKQGSAFISIPTTATVYRALERMVEHIIGALLVMDDEKFVGIFTERDYARKVILKGKSSRDTLIQETMTENPITVTPDHTIEACMDLMTNHSFRHLPVVQGDKLVGLISILDVVKHVIDEQKSTINNLEKYITG